MATNTTLNAEINEAKSEIPSITNLATISTLNTKINKVKTKYLILLTNPTTKTCTAVENKIPNVSNLVRKTHYNTKISKFKNKANTDHDHDKYITTQ